MTEQIQDPRVSWESLRREVEAFSGKLESALNELGMLESCKGMEIDHICVRLKNDADVKKLKTHLSEIGQIISSVNVNGREISIIQLNEGLDLGSWHTHGLELPYPKPAHNYEDGWEHIEFVLNNADNTMEGVRTAFFVAFPKLDLRTLQSQYEYTEDEPHSDSDQMPNPTISLKINGVGIKFHANPIQKVVGYSE